MINKITFSGRETMLTKGLENNAEKRSKAMYDYVGTGKIFENTKASKISKPADFYTSPFNPTGTLKKDSFESNKVMAAKIEDAKAEAAIEKEYALAHGTPEKNINIVI